MRLSHQTAQEYIHAAADGVLEADAAEHLRRHLNSCAACRTYAVELEQLELDLRQALITRWEAPTFSQQELYENARRVQTRLGRRHWVRQLYNGVQVIAWAGVIVALVIGVLWIFQIVTPEIGVTPADTPTPLQAATPTPVSMPSPTPEIVVEPSPSELEPPSEQAGMLTICMGSEPDSLYLYGSSMLAAHHVREAIYDGPIDTNSYDYQPVILEKLPSLADGDATIRSVRVENGQTVVNDQGQPTTLQPGVRVRPTGCHSSECGLAFDGTPLEMEQMVVTFTLRPGLRWSDGEPLTAYDSVYSYELARDPDTPNDKQQEALTARYAVLDDSSTIWMGLPGYRDSAYFTRFWSPLPAHLWGSLTALELASAPESNRTPLGWGPYVIAEWVAGEQITLRRNPHYWRADEGLPHFDTLVYRFVGENASANVVALLAGECDIVDQTARLEEQSGVLLELQAVGKLNATFVTGTVWEHLDFGITPAESYDRPDFFGDLRVRQAVAYCLDRQTVVDSVMYGRSPVLHGYLPPEHPLYNPDVRRYPFDPKRGAELLDSVGWVDADGNPETPRIAQGVTGVSDGTPLILNYATTDADQRRAVAEILASSLAQCGIEANLEFWSAGELFADGPDGPLFGRHFDLAQFAWLTGVEPSCELYLGSEVPNEANGWAGQNNPGFVDPAYDAACQAARQTLPGTPEYEQNHMSAQRIFAEQLPALPLYLRLKLAATRPEMQGFVMDPTASSEFWNIEAFDRTR
jgi:peptide/nickel transport system substrate-binding protein